MYAYMNVRMMRAYERAGAHALVCPSVCLSVCMYVYMYVCIYVCMCISIYACMCVRTSVCMYICMSVTFLTSRIKHLCWSSGVHANACTPKFEVRSKT